MKDLEKILVVGVKLLGISGVVGLLGGIVLAAIGLSTLLITGNPFAFLGSIAIGAVLGLIVVTMAKGFVANHLFGWGKPNFKGYLITGGLMFVVSMLSNLPGVLFSLGFWITTILSIPIGGYIGMTFLKWK